MHQDNSESAVTEEGEKQKPILPRCSHTSHTLSKWNTAPTNTTPRLASGPTCHLLSLHHSKSVMMVSVATMRSLLRVMLPCSEPGAAPQKTSAKGGIRTNLSQAMTTSSFCPGMDQCYFLEPSVASTKVSSSAHATWFGPIYTRCSPSSSSNRYCLARGTLESIDWPWLQL